MADNKYPYSAELKAPADNSKVDYDDPKTIAEWHCRIIGFH